jgi:hypothetical protein
MYLLRSAYKFGELYKKGTTIKTWNKYFVIFAGSYLYLFNSKTDMQAANYIYIKDSEVIPAPNNEREHCFKLRNKRNEEEIFSVDNEKMY